MNRATVMAGVGLIALLVAADRLGHLVTTWAGALLP